jgi:hypothetical protein
MKMYEINTGYILNPKYNKFDKAIILCGIFTVISDDINNSRDLVLKSLYKLDRVLNPFIISVKEIKDNELNTNIIKNNTILSAYDNGTYWLA